MVGGVVEEKERKRKTVGFVVAVAVSHAASVCRTPLHASLCHVKSETRM